MDSATETTMELATVEHRLAQLSAERDAIPKRIAAIEPTDDEALADGTETRELDDELAKLQRRQARVSSAIETLRRGRSDLRACRTPEDAGEALREPFA